MSIAEIERFAADLKSNEALRAEAGKYSAERHHETPIAGCVSFAGSKGYVFTPDEAKEHIKTMAKAAGRELTDAELDGVAGGAVDTAALNAKYGAMLEAISANKGLEEDKANRIATQLQATKDFSQKTSDFFSAYIDLLRGISSKINQ